MSGGPGGGRWGGGEPEVTSGQANVTPWRRFGDDGETLAEKQEGWRATDNGGWRTTEDLVAFGGRPLRGGSAACASCGAWQGFRR
jgi:hypothetical protein